MIVKIAAALKIHPADLFLRNASTTVSNTKIILNSKLLPQIESFIDNIYSSMDNVEINNVSGNQDVYSFIVAFE